MVPPEDNDDFQDAQAAVNNPQIAKMAPKLPPFWESNPRVWFKQIESNFAIAGITQDTTKYNHVVASIEARYLQQVEELILDPPAVEKYAKLKERLIKEFSDSETKKLNTLLQTIELGDQKPSHLLREMKKLAGVRIR
jgi:hypothetical protein